MPGAASPTPGRTAETLHVLPTVVVPQHLVVGPRRASAPSCGPGTGTDDRDRPPERRRAGAAGRAGARRLRCRSCCSARTTPTRRALFGAADSPPYPKDGINDHVVHGAATVNPERRGHQGGVLVPGDGRSRGETVELRLRLRPVAQPAAAEALGTSFERVLEQRRAEADAFYAELTPGRAPADRGRWSCGRPSPACSGASSSTTTTSRAGSTATPAQPPPPAGRQHGRNARWRHFDAFDIMSMPDPWEYPWFAAWDSAFHCVALAHVDPAFAKYQLILLCREWFQHPNGALPAYEWAFDDLNPPVQAWAALRGVPHRRRPRPRVPRAGVREAAAELHLVGQPRSRSTTATCSRAASSGWTTSARSTAPTCRPAGGWSSPTHGLDGLLHACTCWRSRPSSARAPTCRARPRRSSSCEHFVAITDAHRPPGPVGRGGRLLLRPPRRARRQPLAGAGALDGRRRAAARRRGGRTSRRSRDLALFRKTLRADARATEHRPRILESAGFVLGEPGDRRLLFGIVPPPRLVRVFERLFDEAEFLSPYGLRSISAAHREHPVTIQLDGGSATRRLRARGVEHGDVRRQLQLARPGVVPAQLPRSSARSEGYGQHIGDSFTIEYPTGPGERLHARPTIADDLRRRLISLFVPGERRPAALLRLGAAPAGRPELAPARACSTSTSTATTARASARPTRPAGRGSWPTSSAGARRTGWSREHRLRTPGLRRPRRGRRARVAASPTAWAATPWAPSPACAPAATTALLVVPGDGVAARRVGLASLDAVVVAGDRRDPAGHPRVGRAAPSTRRARRSSRRSSSTTACRAGAGRSATWSSSGSSRWRTAAPASPSCTACWPGAGPVRLELTPLCTWRDAHGERHADGAPAVEHGRDGFGLRGRLPRPRPGLDARRRVVPRRPAREEAARGLAPARTCGPPAGSPPSSQPGEAVAVDGLGRRRSATCRRRRRRSSRPRAAARARAAGARRDPVDDVRRSWRSPPTSSSSTTPTGPTCVAGYPWFGEWSRDTMTSYEGLFLATGRPRRGPRGCCCGPAATLSEGMLANTADTGSPGVQHRRRDAVVPARGRPARRRHRRRRPGRRRWRRPATRDRSSTTAPAPATASASTPPTACCTQGADGLALTWMDARVDGAPGHRPRRARRSRSTRCGSTALAAIAGLLGRARPATRPTGTPLRARRAPDVVRAPLRPRRTARLLRRGRRARRRRRRACARTSCSPCAPAARARPADRARSSRRAARALLTSLGLRSLAPGRPGYRGRAPGRPGGARPRLPPGHGLAVADRARTSTRRARCGADAPACSTAWSCTWRSGASARCRETADGDAPHGATGCPFQAWSVAEVLRVRPGVLEDGEGRERTGREARTATLPG